MYYIDKECLMQTFCYLRSRLFFSAESKGIYLQLFRTILENSYIKYLYLWNRRTNKQEYWDAPVTVFFLWWIQMYFIKKMFVHYWKFVDLDNNNWSAHQPCISSFNQSLTSAGHYIRWAMEYLIVFFELSSCICIQLCVQNRQSTLWRQLCLQWFS